MNRNKPPNTYIGKKFGRLTIMSILERDSKSNLLVGCLCDCNQTDVLKVIPLTFILNGNTKSCGCRGLPSIGTIKINKAGLSYEILEYIREAGSARNRVRVRFLGTNTEVITGLKEAKEGKVKDKYNPQSAGVGFLGEGYYCTNGKDKVCHQTWDDMIKRCYAPKTKEIASRYSGVTVHPKWHNYQNFAEWYYSHVVTGWQLDKDMLVIGNKLYSEGTCIFVPVEINAFLTGGLKRGIHYANSKNLWVAQCQNGELCSNGKKRQSYIGSFNTEAEALYAYKNFKLAKLETLKTYYGEVIPEIVFNNIAEVINNLK